MQESDINHSLKRKKSKTYLKSKSQASLEKNINETNKENDNQRVFTESTTKYHKRLLEEK